LLDLLSLGCNRQPRESAGSFRNEFLSFSLSSGRYVVGYAGLGESHLVPFYKYAPFADRAETVATFQFGPRPSWDRGDTVWSG